MSRPIVATLHLAAFSHNLAVIRRLAPAAKVWAVVKANAYGHGLARVWRSLSSCDGFALLDLNEAILLREQGWEGPVLLLEGFFQPAELEIIDHYHLTTAVHSPWQLQAIAAARLTRPLSVYLKMNSGMNRLGFAPDQMHAVWRQVQAIRNIGSLTLMSHFANADNAQGVEAQYALIRQGTEGISVPFSLANSAATLWHPQTHHEWVRPGVILYGASPSGSRQDIAESGLRPVMQLSSELIAIQHLGQGASVGYGSRYISRQQAQRIGVVACGYADGYPRHAPTGTPIMVDGVRTRTLGTVSMDMLTVDLSPCPQAEIGSPVELWGAEVGVDEVATAAGSVGYELMCAVAPRVPVVTRP